MEGNPPRKSENHHDLRSEIIRRERAPILGMGDGTGSFSSGRRLAVPLLALVGRGLRPRHPRAAHAELEGASPESPLMLMLERPSSMGRGPLRKKRSLSERERDRHTFS